jgi:hypothetical protein
VVQAVLLEELIHGDARDRDAKGGVDEVQQLSAGGVRVAQQEAGDWSGETRQEFAVGAALEAVMRLLDDLFGRQALLL